MRKKRNYEGKHGPASGGKLYHALQSQAAYAGVAARRLAQITALRNRLRKLKEQVAELRRRLHDKGGSR
jgi:division protein CdvB (Snf7/Vps24/ESCRT-III family)